MMFKHSDNLAHPAGTMDPTGMGYTTSASSARGGGSIGGSGSGIYDVSAPVTTAAPPPAAAAVATAGGRKRGRDIRGLDRFRQVVYGDKGFPRLHAMATRNPVLMYPPEGIPDARQRHHLAQHLQRQREEEEERASKMAKQSNSALNGGETAAAVVVGPQARSFVADDEALWAMFDERKKAELEAEEAITAASAAINNFDPSLTTIVDPPSSLSGGGGGGVDDDHDHEQALQRRYNPLQDEQLANHHHKQLDTFLRLLYEFNHTTFVKLPMQDTLALLSRCGKESVAHVLEFETQLRMAREAKLKELKELKDMKAALRQRAAAVVDEDEEWALAEAERVQAVLDLEEQKEEGELHVMNPVNHTSGNGYNHGVDGKDAHYFSGDHRVVSFAADGDNGEAAGGAAVAADVADDEASSLPSPPRDGDDDVGEAEGQEATAETAADVLEEQSNTAPIAALEEENTAE